MFVAALPRGADPADLAGRDPSALVDAVRDARPFLGFRVGRVLATAKLDTPESRARAAESALALVMEHPNPIVKRDYAGSIAMQCGVPVADLVDQVNRGVRQPHVPVPSGPAPRRDDAAEVVALRLLVHRFSDIAPYLIEALFTEPDTLGAFRAMAAALTAAPDAPVSQLVHRAIEHAEPAAAELLTRLAVDEVDPDVDAGAEARNLIGSVARRAWKRAMADAKADGDWAAATALGEARLWIDELANESDPTAESDPAGQLLLWLDGRVEERS